MDIYQQFFIFFDSSSFLSGILRTTKKIPNMYTEILDMLITFTAWSDSLHFNADKWFL